MAEQKGRLLQMAWDAFKSFFNNVSGDEEGLLQETEEEEGRFFLTVTGGNTNGQTQSLVVSNANMIVTGLIATIFLSVLFAAVALSLSGSSTSSGSGYASAKRDGHASNYAYDRSSQVHRSLEQAAESYT